MSSRWKIDDTTRPGHIVVEHLARPRLTGELVPADQAAEDSLAIPAPPGGRCVTHIRFCEPTGITWYEEQDMYDSPEAALKAHAAETKAAINRRTPKRRGPA